MEFLALATLSLFIACVVIKCGSQIVEYATALHEKEVSLNQLELKEFIKRTVQAEEELARLHSEGAAQVRAIEQGALPWVAKDEKLEARFESEALDNLDRPWADNVSGLGGTS